MQLGLESTGQGSAQISGPVAAKALPPEETARFVKIYHIEHGESDWMYKIDAKQACTAHPHEWRAKPWTADERAAAAASKEPPTSKPVAHKETLK